VLNNSSNLANRYCQHSGSVNKDSPKKPAKVKVKIKAFSFSAKYRVVSCKNTVKVAQLLDSSDQRRRPGVVWR